MDRSSGRASPQALDRIIAGRRDAIDHPAVYRQLAEIACRLFEGQGCPSLQRPADRACTTDALAIASAWRSGGDISLPSSASQCG